MVVEVRQGSISKHVDAIDELIAMNWNETGFDFPLDFDKELYKRFEAAGILIAIGAFLEGQVVGYSIASVLPHPFNPAVIFCNSDCLFLRKDLRNTSAGARLVFETERVAKQRGAHFVLWHARGDTEFADALMKREDYDIADVVFMKRLNYGY